MGTLGLVVMSFGLMRPVLIVVRVVREGVADVEGAWRRDFDVEVGSVGFGAVSLHSVQFLIAAETVSFIRTQWYFSAMLAVVLLKGVLSGNAHLLRH